MRNEVNGVRAYFKKVNGKLVLKIRMQIPVPKVFKDTNRYSRKMKHKGGREW